MVEKNNVNNSKKQDLPKNNNFKVLKDKEKEVDKSNKAKTHSFVVAGSTFTVETKYKLIKQIGQGAYGIVCSCKDTSKDSSHEFYKVAIKKVHNAFEDLIDAKRILREIKLLKFFNHENIVSLLDIPKPPGKTGYEDIYFITDLMGTDLHKVIYSKQDLSDEYVQFFIYQIIRGVLYMHSANVVHRDLKPSNILSNADCHVKICDLGLGRGGMPEDDEETEKIDKKNAELNNDEDIGLTTAPEVILCPSNYSKSVDIWSLGCILGELLGRKPMFDGQNYLDQIQKITGILGSPSSSELEFVTKLEAREFMLKLPKKKAKPFNQLYPNANPLALDLLGKMLTFNPNNRATIEDCISHPYFKELHDPGEEPISDKHFDWSFDDLKLTKENLQKMVYEESLFFHPEN